MSLKARFAMALLESNDPMVAAQAVSTSIVQRFEIATSWPADPEVKEAIGQIEAEREAARLRNLPTKAEFLASLNDRLGVETDGKAFASMAKLYAEIAEFMPEKNKPAEAPTQNVTNVMIVHEHGSEDDWSHKAVKSQRALIAQGEERH